ncbi:Hypothetical predicted protein [Mytilus galloprovincialis]|uniref:Uncharacterized protein n=1 Tax=Mytilus galloprovincialis TaxID=29158 RepID=A0A8B6C4D7_MYTGA|nr:Hypothetical predicted protein [Mytilus galloprovincialis]
MSVPRLELCGAVLAARIRQKLVEEMDYKFSRVIHIVDSMIVRAQIQRESYGFGTFVATRVAEIQNKTEPSDWWWVPSEFNAADLATRITSPNDLVKNSIWKNGPQFLNDPIDQWPLRQDCNLGNDELPDTIDVKLENISSYSKLLRVTCILMRIVTTKSFKGASMAITDESLNAAELEWIRYLQRDISDD